jgi:hypothetical protein
MRKLFYGKTKKANTTADKVVNPAVITLSELMMPNGIMLFYRFLLFTVINFNPRTL